MGADQRVLAGWPGLRFAAAVALAVSPVGCATHAAPDGFLPDPTEAQTAAHGSWIQLLTRDSAWVAGELIAVDEDSVWVLPLTGVARAVATDAVGSGKLVAYDAEDGRVGVATLLGMGSTISNGAFLIFNAPLWLLVGTIAAANQSHAPVHELPPMGVDNPEGSWLVLAPFARFPQGMPAAVSRASLRSRPAPPEPTQHPLWATGGGGIGLGGFAATVGVGAGEDAWTIRGRFTYLVWPGDDGNTDQGEWALLVGYRPPQRWEGAVYDFAVGAGTGWHQGYRTEPCDFSVGGANCRYVEHEGPLPGIALSAGLARPDPRWYGLRLEAFANLNPWHPFVGVAAALELGRLPR